MVFPQREAVEALIQELPKFRLKAVPTDCSECPICLEEFHVGNEVKPFVTTPAHCTLSNCFHLYCTSYFLGLGYMNYSPSVRREVMLSAFAPLQVFYFDVKSKRFQYAVHTDHIETKT